MSHEISYFGRNRKMSREKASKKQTKTEQHYKYFEKLKFYEVLKILTLHMMCDVNRDTFSLDKMSSFFKRLIVSCIVWLSICKKMTPKSAIMTKNYQSFQHKSGMAKKSVIFGGFIMWEENHSLAARVVLTFTFQLDD